MGDIVFVAPHMPSIAGRAESVRAYHVLKQLGARRRVHLVTFADTPADLKRKEALIDITATRSIVWRPEARLRPAVEALALHRAVPVVAFSSAAMRVAIDEALRRRVVDAVYILSARMAGYAPPASPQRTIVIDLVERASEKIRIGNAQRHWPARLWAAREAALLARYERMAMRRADISLFDNDLDAGLAPGVPATGQVRVVESGVDSAWFDPLAAYRRIEPSQPLILFAGRMDDRPNRDAAIRFVETVLPHVRIHYPTARLAVFGAGPNMAALHRHDGMMVIDEEDDPRSWLAAASVVIASSLVGGAQNGVLEAMAMARPIIASTPVADGIDHGGTIRIGDTVGELAGHVGWALSEAGSAERLGAAARARVLWRYDWAQCLAPLDRIFAAGLVRPYR